MLCLQVQAGYASEWLGNSTGGRYVAFGAGSRVRTWRASSARRQCRMLTWRCPCAGSDRK
jgi:hypothetical protein